MRERNIIIQHREITMDRETTTAQEITTDHEITMGRDDITTSDEIRATATIMIRHGMDAPQDGRFRGETAHPTEVQ